MKRKQVTTRKSPTTVGASGAKSLVIMPTKKKPAIHIGKLIKVTTALRRNQVTDDDIDTSKFTDGVVKTSITSQVIIYPTTFNLCDLMLKVSDNHNPSTVNLLGNLLSVDKVVVTEETRNKTPVDGDEEGEYFGCGLSEVGSDISTATSVSNTSWQQYQGRQEGMSTRKKTLQQPSLPGDTELDTNESEPGRIKSCLYYQLPTSEITKHFILPHVDAIYTTDCTHLKRFLMLLRNHKWRCIFHRMVYPSLNRSVQNSSNSTYKSLLANYNHAVGSDVREAVTRVFIGDMDDKRNLTIENIYPYDAINSNQNFTWELHALHEDLRQIGVERDMDLGIVKNVLVTVNTENVPVKHSQAMGHELHIQRYMALKVTYTISLGILKNIIGNNITGGNLGENTGELIETLIHEPQLQSIIEYV